MEEPHLQVVDFIMVFMLRVQEPVYRREAEEVICDLQGFGTEQELKGENPPYYIVYIVSVHAFESLCWKAHSYDVWVDIC